MKGKSVWSTILKVVIAVATAIMGHRTKRFFYWSVKMGGRL